MIMQSLGEREVLSFLNFESSDVEDDYDDRCALFLAFFSSRVLFCSSNVFSLPCSDYSEDFTPDSSAISSPLPAPLDMQFESEQDEEGTYYFEVPGSFLVELEHAVDNNQIDQEALELMMAAHEQECEDNMYEDYDDGSDEDEDEDDDDDEETIDSVAIVETMTVIEHATIEAPSTPRKRRLSVTDDGFVVDGNLCDSDDSNSTAPSTPIPSTPDRKRSKLEDRLAVLMLTRRPPTATLRNLSKLLCTSASTEAILGADLGSQSQSTLLSLNELVEGALRETPDDSQKIRRSRKQTARRKNVASPSKQRSSSPVLVLDEPAAVDDEIGEDEEEEIDVVNM